MTARTPAVRAAPDWWQRMVDVGVGLLLLPVWLPALALAAAAALVLQGRPVLYRARRLGRGGGTFDMLKLRTMETDADRRGPGVSGAADPRITPLGRVLRATKLDELPQFLHVLAGRMSVVGPRPEAPVYRAHFTPAGERALAYRPGLTGYGALWFYFHDGAEAAANAADFERHYVTRLLPDRLALDAAGGAELAGAPLRTTVRLIGWTLLAVPHRLGGRGLPAGLRRRCAAALAEPWTIPEPGARRSASQPSAAAPGPMPAPGPVSPSH